MVYSIPIKQHRKPVVFSTVPSFSQYEILSDVLAEISEAFQKITCMSSSWLWPCTCSYEYFCWMLVCMTLCNPALTLTVRLICMNQPQTEAWVHANHDQISCIKTFLFTAKSKQTYMLSSDLQHIKTTC